MGHGNGTGGWDRGMIQGDGTGDGKRGWDRDRDSGVTGDGTKRCERGGT